MFRQFFQLFTLNAQPFTKEEWERVDPPGCLECGSPSFECNSRAGRHREAATKDEWEQVDSPRGWHRESATEVSISDTLESFQYKMSPMKDNPSHHLPVPNQYTNCNLGVIKYHAYPNTPTLSHYTFDAEQVKNYINLFGFTRICQQDKKTGYVNCYALVDSSDFLKFYPKTPVK